MSHKPSTNYQTEYTKPLLPPHAVKDVSPAHTTYSQEDRPEDKRVRLLHPGELPSKRFSSLKEIIIKPAISLAYKVLKIAQHLKPPVALTLV